MDMSEYEILKAKLSIFYFIESEEVQEDFPEVENLLKETGNFEGFPQVNDSRQASKMTVKDDYFDKFLSHFRANLYTWMTLLILGWWFHISLGATTKVDLD